MKKSSQKTSLFESKPSINKFSKKPVENKIQETEKSKTTNVNILLNRVRLDKKKDFRKKIIFLSILIFVISAVTIYLIIQLIYKIN